jgi:hypothetical protein
MTRLIVSLVAVGLLSCCSIRTEELHNMALKECPDLIDAYEKSVGNNLLPSDKALVDWCKAQMKVVP